MRERIELFRAGPSGDGSGDARSPTAVLVPQGGVGEGGGGASAGLKVDMGGLEVCQLLTPSEIPLVWHFQNSKVQ